MTIRKDDPAHPVKAPSLDKKGFPAGVSPEADNDMGFNGQTPPGMMIQNQMLSQDVKRITGLKVHSAASVLASGTKNLG